MDAIQEAWKVVAAWPRYEVSSHGRLRSTHKRQPGVLACSTDRYGYKRIMLCESGRRAVGYVHRLVLLTFVGEPARGQEVLHIDGNKQNNAVTNLRWGTRSENLVDAYRHGDMRPRRALTDEQIAEVAASKELQKVLAKRYGVSETVISYARNGRYTRAA